MQIQLLKDWPPGRKVAGDTVDVSEAIGNRLISLGMARAAVAAAPEPEPEPPAAPEPDTAA